MILNLESSEPGGTANWDTLGIGYAYEGAADSRVRVRGSNTTLNITQETTAYAFLIGSAGRGAMQVSGGANVDSDTELRIGKGGSARGTLDISGANSRVRILNRHTYVGSSGTGFLTVTNGGVFYAYNGRFFVSASEGSTGVVTVAGAGSTVLGWDDMGIGGISSSRTDSDATVTVRDGGYLRAEDEINVFRGATLSVAAPNSSRSYSVYARGTAGNGGIIGYEGSTFDFTLHASNVEPSAMVCFAYSYGPMTIEDNVTLTVSLGDDYVHTYDSEINLFRYVSGLTGTFEGLDDGDRIAADGKHFEIDYGAGTGADYIKLIAVPPQGTVIFVR